MSAIPTPTPDPKAVIQKAFVNAGKALKLTNEELGQIIGKDRQTITRTKAPEAFKPESKTGEAALNFIRVYRSLSALTGHNQDSMAHWLNTYNTHLGFKPKELLFKTQDLIRVVTYLDAMRGNM